ncbi:hypothetical protein MUK42_17336 [Musa troglodytarum]|uniref:DUF4378 domain-containing protein n=1 Tax=Musa troglodytarum TaxID=320322 RepID=A0A9E7H8Y2_9LILI|nr:hypothetical protein MUK42_17336 [Musa troglodytarum]
MTPGVVGEGGVLEEQRLERQMGCVAGFLQLFDRHHGVAGRRRYSVHRLPTSPTAASTSPSERSEASSASILKESHPPPSSPEPCPSSPERGSAKETPARRSLPLSLPVFEVTDGVSTTWRIRDIPRLSLDSRAVVDARGKLRPREIRTAVPVSSGNQTDASEAAEEQRRSPSVVARLMGLGALPSAGGEGGAEPRRAELRRSASESRVRRDPSTYGFVDVGSFHKPWPSPAAEAAAPVSAEEFFKTVNLARFRLIDATKAKPPSRSTLLQPLQRKIFHAEDFFPEPKRSVTLYGEIEKRLRLRGIDEPAKDLETLKQILEALQLKGLLHSKPSDHRVTGRRNLISDYEGRIQGEAPIVIMKLAPKPLRRRSSEPPRSVAARQSSSPLRRERSPVHRTIRGGNERTNRAPRSPESPSSPVLRTTSNAAAQKSVQAQRRISTVGSSKCSPKMTGPDPPAVRSPRSRRPTAPWSPEEKVYASAEDDTSTTLSENSISVSSQLDLEVMQSRSRASEYRSGRSLLDRCDKLLHSIAAFTGAEQVAAADQQPSPVSVLDSSAFLAEEGSPSPSPLSKRSIDFKDRAAEDWEAEQWAWTNHGDVEGGADAVDRDYAYVCDAVRATRRYGEASDAVYATLEKGRCRHPAEASEAARLHRRVVFDTVSEMLDRKRRVPPWDAFSSPSGPSPGGCGEEEALLREVWAEVRRIREQVADDDQDAVACGAVRKDMSGALADGWARQAAEMSDAVLHIERLIFKDVVAETIRDLAAAPSAPRRKLLF